MHEKYIKLFEELARVTAISAEHVMDYDHDKGDEKGFETAQIMRDNYEELKEKIKAAGNDYILNQADAAKLIVGAFILIQQLKDQIESRQKALNGYQNDLIPKLQKIVDETNTDEEAKEMAEKIFMIENNE